MLARLFLDEKRVAKFWFNHQWLCRTIAIKSFLAAANERIIINDGMDGDGIIIDEFRRFRSPVGIRDEFESADDVIEISSDEAPDIPEEAENK